MSIKFSVVGRKNPSVPNSPYKYYPQFVSSGVSDFKTLARKIQKNTGQGYADVIGVLAALEDIIPDEIKEGKIIRLGGLGSFYTQLKGDATDTPEDFTVRNINDVSIRFRAEKGFKEMINTGVTFERVATATAAEPEEEETEQ